MSSDDFQPLQGMADIGPPEIARWHSIEQSARRMFSIYRFEEVRTPIVERLDLFVRSLGDSTDVVQKEMYAFEDRGGRRLALRPEGTAGVLRYIASKGQEAAEARVFYIGPMFRAERPQAGRRRQFHQLGAEAIGAPNPLADAEMIALHAELLRAWGIERFQILINTRGLPEERSAVQEKFRELLAPHREALCDDCRRRLDANVLRALDCKNPACRAIVESLPTPVNLMSDASRAYFDDVVRLLESLSIPVSRAPRLVRGLDYYAHTVWEITHPGLGAQDAIAGGGRYRLDLGGRAIEGVGFAIGMERALMALESERSSGPVEARRPLVWLVSQGDRARVENVKLMQTLRRHGVPCQMCLDARSVKAQFRSADRAGAAVAVIRGDSELDQGLFAFKDLARGEQVVVDLAELMKRVLPFAVN